MDQSPKKPPVKILIMSGGKGTRMWPISNLAHPKQFESILGNKSMFRETVERVLRGFSAEDIYIATSIDYREHIVKQAPEVPRANFLFEPAMRDNLGALGLATAIINHRHPDSVMLLLWGADHLIRKPDVFLAALKQAAELARQHQVMVHVDTTPTYPTVHNGWIEIGKHLDRVGGFDVFEFIHQIEKPDLQKAKKLYHSDHYLIHTGYMATRPKLLLEYYRRYAPATYSLIQTIIAALDTPVYQQVLAREYPKFEKTSVDYGLYEKLPKNSQWELPAEFGWIDVGTWELLYHGLDKDRDGNVVIGTATLLDTHNSLIIAKKNGTMGVIGMEEMIVVETDSGMLACPLASAPRVKELYQVLHQE